MNGVGYLYSIEHYSSWIVYIWVYILDTELELCGTYELVICPITSAVVDNCCEQLLDENCVK